MIGRMQARKRSGRRKSRSVPSQQAEPAPRRLKPALGCWRSLFVIIALAIAALALYGLARPGETLPQAAPAATPTPLIPVLTPRSGHVGIIAGHWGNDSGAVCDDGLTEGAVNLDIARRVETDLARRGYQVDLLQEFDGRLAGYQADALLSIHADSCEYVNDEATGFKVASAANRPTSGRDEQLVDCLTQRYARRTGLPFHASSITYNMTDYHGFHEISPATPAAIIETGFLYLDRAILTRDADKLAQGIVEGLECFLENEPP